MSALATRLHRLEQKHGADDTERYLRSLTDDELQAEIDKLHALCREHLTKRGVACADMPIKEVLAKLEALEAADAAAEQKDSPK